MFIKDPSAVLPYIVDWTAWMEAGDSITAAAWTSTGLTVQESPAPSNTETTATVWLSGGAAGTTYSVDCHITTTNGLQDSRQLLIEVTHR
jgi:hypothetical protein